MIVIVGTGLAGLTAALVASRHDDVLVVTKATITDANTSRAQGGIAAAIGPGDTPDQHAQDTLAAGHGLCDPEAVRVLASDGATRVRELIAAGVPFDRAGDDFARALEAAHGRPRVLHAGGDATGMAIESTMAEHAANRGVTIAEHTFFKDLVVTNGRVRAVRLLSPAGERTVATDAVILASGGVGQLFAHTTNPAIATGDGAAAAWRAGAVLADCEFVQFHPTSLAVPDNFLISEAVRGAGAILLTQDGHRFMPEVDPRAELAPRDVVAETIARVMLKQDGQPVLLDATAVKGFAEEFPSITEECARWGLDPRTDPLPVTPAAHYWMGGVRTDLAGRTSIPGLYAAGEVACTGVHGANRLASNSLLEALVFGHRAATAACDDDDAAQWPQWQARAVSAPSTLVGGSDDENQLGALLSPSVSRQNKISQEDRAAHEQRTQPRRGDIQHLMWESVGVSRTGDELTGAAAQLGQWAAAPPCDPRSVADLEIRNLATLGAVIAQAGYERTESRGAHRRSDFPQLDEHQAVRVSRRLDLSVVMHDAGHALSGTHAGASS